MSDQVQQYKLYYDGVKVEDPPIVIMHDAIVSRWRYVKVIEPGRYGKERLCEGQVTWIDTKDTLIDYVK